MAVILGIESTCDETAAAVVVDGHLVRSNVIATQFELHEKYRGVVPEIASRAHIENILPVLKESLEKAGVTLEQVDAIAVAHRPGLIGSLLIGVTAAKTLAWSMQKPLIGVDHVHAHLYSVVLEERHEGTEARRHEGEGSAVGVQGSALDVGRSERAGETSNAQLPTSNIQRTPSRHRPTTPSGAPTTPSFPAVGMVVSGGHTALYRVGSWEDVELIGTTIDDAVGEAYDKVAAILGLGFPGGPVIDRLAQRGDPAAVRFPRSLLGRESLDFSFSGLKTAVLYHVRGHQGRERDAQSLSEREVVDVAASFQAACVDVLIRKLRRAVERTGAKSIIVGGGVSANSGLRKALQELDLPVHLPALPFCTDNAAMSAGLAHVYYEQGRFSELDLDAITHSQFRD
jgi:N6-L-threonylcarbamoyladenine synthase